jgi:hypothetical protein
LTILYRRRQNFNRSAGRGAPLGASWAGAVMQIHHLHHLKAAPARNNFILCTDLLQFVDASAGADHGYSTSMSEEESWDESDDERRPRLVNNSWTSRAAACQLHQRRSEQLHGSSDSKFPMPRAGILQRVFAMQLLVLLL